MAPPDRVIGVGKRVEPTSTSSSALPWHGRGQGFDSPQVHQRDSMNALRGVFLRVASRTATRVDTAYFALSRYAQFLPTEVVAGRTDFRFLRRLERHDPEPS